MTHDSQAGTDSPNDPDASAKEQVAELTTGVSSDIEEVQKLTDSVQESVVQAESLLEEWAVDVAELEAENGETVMVDAYVSALSDVADHHNKTTITSIVDNARGNVGNGQQPLNKWLAAHVTHVEELRNRDQKSDTVWRWQVEFDSESYSFQTSTTEAGVEHFAFPIMRTKIYTATGYDPDKPESEYRDGGAWRDWIVEFVNARKAVDWFVGARSIAAEQMTDWVSRTEAYTSLGDAVSRTAVAIDQDNDELHVPLSHIQRFCDHAEISPRDLQVEYSARGWLVNRVSGASEVQRADIDGESQTVRVWVLDLDAIPCEPANVVDEVETPAERVGSVGDDDDDDGSDDSTQTTDESTGLLERVGGADTEEVGGDA